MRFPHIDRKLIDTQQKKKWEAFKNIMKIGKHLTQFQKKHKDH